MKDQKIIFKISKEQKNEVKRQAESLGLTVSSYARMIIIKNGEKNGIANITNN